MAKKRGRPKTKRKRPRSGRSAQSGFSAGRIEDDEVRDDEPTRVRTLRGSENRPALSRWHPDYEAAFEAFMARKPAV